jgi:hypothetical protein
VARPRTSGPGRATGDWGWLASLGRPDSGSARPPLMLLLVLLAVGLQVALTVWATRPTASPPEIDLLTSSNSFNLNTNSAEDDAVLPGPAVFVQSDVPDARAEQLPPALPEVPLEPPRLLGVGETAPVVAAPATDPVTYAIYTTFRGDSPMMRHWKLIGLQTALAAALTAPTLAAAEPEPKLPPPLATPDKSDEILKKLSDFKKTLDSLETSLRKDLTDLRNDQLNSNLKVQKLQGDVTKLQETIGKSPAPNAKLLSDIDDIKKQLSLLKLDLDALKSKATPPRISASAPTSDAARIRLVNTYAEQVTIVVNQRAYRVLPGETRLLESQPQGAFTYQVLGVQPGLQNRTLAANETFTINVHPQ